MSNIAFPVWRAEDRTNPDSVDFWDFVSQENARKFVNDLKRDDNSERKYDIRLLSDEEIIQTALMFYYNTLKER